MSYYQLIKKSSSLQISFNFNARYQSVTCKTWRSFLRFAPVRIMQHVHTEHNELQFMRHFTKSVISCLSNFFLWRRARLASSNASTGQQVVCAGKAALLRHPIFVLNTSCRRATRYFLLVPMTDITKQNILNLNCSLGIKLQKSVPSVKEYPTAGIQTRGFIFLLFDETHLWTETITCLTVTQLDSRSESKMVGTAISLHSFWTSALRWKWVVNFVPRPLSLSLSLRKYLWYPLKNKIGWVPEKDWTLWRKLSCICKESNHDSSVLQLVP